MTKMNKKIKLYDQTMYIDDTQKYMNGRMAVEIYDSEGPFMTLSVNVPEAHNVEEGEFIVKTYSENEPFIDEISESGLFIDTGKVVLSGFATMPIWKFKPIIPGKKGGR